jgi:CBS domain containing-hemolysin-like protein
MSDHPFDNRETRIRRREERNMFRRNLLPVAWALSIIGFGGLLILAGYFFFHGEWLYQYAGLSIALAILPVVLTFISWMRGHHSDRLEEP